MSAIGADLGQRLSATCGSPVAIGPVLPFGDGHSGFNFSFDLTEGGSTRTCVLRLSPPGVRIAGPADIGRQGAIMAALHAAGLPAPGVLDHDSAEVIAGRSFAAMELVEGTDWAAAAAIGSEAGVAAAAVEALHRIQALPADQIPIDEPPQGPLEEVQRWEPLVLRAAAIVDGRADRLLAGLRAEAPQPTAPVLVHGDFHYANLIFGQGEVRAVVDWEIASVGERLVDLGCLAVATLRRRYAPEPNPTGNVDVPLATIVDGYGAAHDEAAWFIAASCLKYAAIIAYNLDLHRRGKRTDAVYEELQGTIGGLLADGEAVLDDGLSALVEPAGAL
jgi:aminoglycoside phosphotransferase (APT) family kinase protein